ncbi:hypothetical protein [Lysinibacillus fusiformis]|uniref:hypothetical protein n=1 Tax=Lysinibacillus fusiformis TaxID=28031 RepID=UPI0023A9393C|nr:hypothetical protein [Lysinibacillus fusiformis]WEA41801.1 hypothetical protein PWJ66_23530 [Lysinibacillus fusiformis]
MWSFLFRYLDKKKSIETEFCYIKFSRDAISLFNLDEVKKFAEFKIGKDFESKETKSDYISNYKIKDPELNHWYQTLPLSDEKKLRKLRAIWDILQEEE